MPLFGTVIRRCSLSFSEEKSLHAGNVEAVASVVDMKLTTRGYRSEYTCPWDYDGLKPERSSSWRALTWRVIDFVVFAGVHINMRIGRFRS